MVCMAKCELAVVCVRRAVTSDVPALVELRSEMFRAMGTSGVDHSEWRRAAQDWFRAHLDDAQVCIVVVEIGPRVVSTAMAAVRAGVPSPDCPGGDDILISNVCTFPEARRQGYGQVAFTALLDWARSTGAARAELMATGDGLTVYEASGFVATRYPAMRVSLSVAPDGP